MKSKIELYSELAKDYLLGLTFLFALMAWSSWKEAHACVLRLAGHKEKADYIRKATDRALRGVVGLDEY